MHDETVRMVSRMTAAFPNGYPEDTVALLLEKVDELVAETGNWWRVSQGVEKVINEAVRPPTIGQLREAVLGTPQDRRATLAYERARESGQRVLGDIPTEPDEVRAARANRGAQQIREVLVAKGLLPPPSEGHADMYEPPLNSAEQRHRYHILQESPQAVVCRFCKPVEEAS